MRQEYPFSRDLVLVGGGHSHALVLKMWGMSPLAGTRLTVVNPYPTAPYTGMLPGFVAGHYTREDVAIDLARLARFAGARLIVDRATGLDREKRLVQLNSGRALRYDVASIDIGITSELSDLKGFPEFGTPIKPMDSFVFAWLEFAARARAGDIPADIAVIGGGVGGAEVAMAIAHAMRDLPDVRISVIEKAKLLGAQGENLAGKVRRRMRDMRIDILEQADARAVTSDRVTLADGKSVPSCFTIGAAGAQAQGWLDVSSGLSLKKGHIRVRPTLQSVTDDRIFAVGDCAHLDHAPRPKAGVYAVRAAPVLHENLRAALSGKALGAYRPQRDYLKLISLGSRTAIAEKWGLAPSGNLMWRWKDRIDRKFMRQFQDLQPMAPPPLPPEHALGMTEAQGAKPLCGGCGAKVGAAALADTLAKLPPFARDDILSGPGDDAALLTALDGMTQVISTDHLRALTDDPFVMAQIALNHALGDIWAMGAAPQSVLPHLILPRASDEMHRDMLAEILAAASQIAVREGAAIIGGHTSVGAELTIGFTVTGLVCRPIALSGAKDGDLLVLTKPIGTGTIMAAEMQMQAPGHVAQGAIRSMTRSQGTAAPILAASAHAMTDVTGFGLAGHAANMAHASGLSVLLDLDRVPFLPGAVDLSAEGVFSSLYPSNLAQAPHLLDPTDPRTSLLFDPQTAGGLLAALPRDTAADTVLSLQNIGFEPAIIGEVMQGDPQVALGRLNL